MRVHITAFTFSVVDGDYSPLSIVATVLLVLATTIVVLRRLGRHAQSTAFVDTHVHLWDAACLPPWLGDPALKPIACTRSVSDHAAAAGPGLAKAVYMEVDVAPEHRDDEARRIVALCEDAENALCGAVIGAPVVDGTLDEFTAYVRRWATHDAVKGVRQVLHIHPRGTCLRDDVVAKARLCGELGLVFELCMRCDELDDAARLADRVPGCRFVLDHCGGHHQLVGEAAASKRAAWEAGISALATRRNVWCKLSGLMGAQGGESGEGSGAAAWSADEQLPTMRHCLRAFSDDRIVLGGDWPVSTLTAPLRDNLASILQLLDDEQPATRAKVLRENAEDVYRL